MDREFFTPHKNDNYGSNTINCLFDEKENSTYIVFVKVYNELLASSYRKNRKKIKTINIFFKK